MKRTSCLLVLILIGFLLVIPVMAQMGRGPYSPTVPGKAATSPLTQCTTIKAAADTDDYPGLFRAASAITILGWHCIQAGATNVVGGVDNCDGNATNCHAVSVDLTCSATESDNSTLNAYKSIAAGKWVGWHTTSVSGTNTWVTVCFDYTIP